MLRSNVLSTIQDHDALPPGWRRFASLWKKHSPLWETIPFSAAANAVFPGIFDCCANSERETQPEYRPWRSFELAWTAPVAHWRRTNCGPRLCRGGAAGASLLFIDYASLFPSARPPCFRRLGLPFSSPGPHQVAPFFLRARASAHRPRIRVSAWLSPHSAQLDSDPGTGDFPQLRQCLPLPSDRIRGTLRNRCVPALETPPHRAPHFAASARDRRRNSANSDRRCRIFLRLVAGVAGICGSVGKSTQLGVSVIEPSGKKENKRPGKRGRRLWRSPPHRPGLRAWALVHCEGGRTALDARRHSARRAAPTHWHRRRRRVKYVRTGL